MSIYLNKFLKNSFRLISRTKPPRQMITLKLYGKILKQVVYSSPYLLILSPYTLSYICKNTGFRWLIHFFLYKEGICKSILERQNTGWRTFAYLSHWTVLYEPDKIWSCQIFFAKQRFERVLDTPLLAGNYLFRVNNGSTKKRCEICSTLTIVTYLLYI